MSQRESGYERKERDLYETPEWVTEALCNNLETHAWTPGVVWEPAAGSGKMLDVLAKKTSAKVIGTDVSPLRSDIGVADFLRSRPVDGFTDVVTNPPYEHAQKFIERALSITPHGIVAMLMRTDFDHAKSRAHLFRHCPAFAQKIVLTRRIAWFVEADGKPKASPSFNHAWYVWRVGNENAPIIEYGP